MVVDRLASFDDLCGVRDERFMFYEELSQILN
jgi:hypothetical protein